MSRIKWLLAWTLYLLSKVLIPMLKALLWFRIRSDILFALVAGKVTDWLCKQTGRSNYRVAMWALIAGVAAVTVDDVIYSLGSESFGSKVFIGMFLPFWWLLNYKASKELIQADQAEPSEVIFKGFWTNMMRSNAWLWSFIGSMSLLASIITLDIPRLQWILMGFAGYAAGHINRGGKSVLQRAKEWLQDRLQVLVPVPA